MCEIGGKEGRLLTGGGPETSEGYFLRPVVIADVGPGARIFQEEIFGPVLAVTPAPNFENALELANDSEYGLTGAVLYAGPGENPAGARPLLRGEPLYQPQVYGRYGRRAPLWRV